jgi:hypothetical protein
MPAGVWRWIGGPRYLILPVLAGGLLASIPGHGGDALARAAVMPQAAAATTGTPLRNGTALYPRAIRLAHSGAANGRVLVSISMFPNTNGTAGIFQSTDDGRSFQPIGSIGDPDATGNRGLCCGTLYELPSAVGGNPAGTLLWAGAIGGNAGTGRRMALHLWRSLDSGQTWSFLSTIAASSSDKGLWEPELSVDQAGELVAFYSDETDPAHSQKIMRVRSTDGLTWTGRSGVVVSSTQGYRPGMPVVRRLPDGSYLMSYEVCGTAGNYACAAYTRSSANGWDWGTASAMGTRAVSTGGDYFRHAPTIAISPSSGSHGDVLLIGQVLTNSSGAVADGNGRTVFERPIGSSAAWQEVSAPVEVPDATSDPCPNYSSALLPSLDGSSMLEVASDYAGTVCESYFATGPLPGLG